jgi:hypothetical protein
MDNKVSENVYYGRRKDDIMSPTTDLPPEVLAKMTDSQKINIKILQNITSINTALNDLQHEVKIHDEILVTGNGKPSLQERIRRMESYIDNLQYWGRFIGGALIIQTIGFFVGIIIAVVRFLPLLERLAAKP